MKINPKRGYIFTSESVAITDVVLNMFIFFFISFSLLYTFDPNHDQAIKIKLPRASSAGKETMPQSLTIVVSSEDIIYVDNKPLTAKELDAYLKKGKTKFSSVLIKADKDSSVGAIVGVWDICAKAGMDKVGIAASKKE